MPRRLCLVPLCLFAVAASIGPSVAAAGVAAGDVRVRLTPTSSTQVPQGAPFTIEVTINNQGSEIAFVDAEFVLRPTGASSRPAAPRSVAFGEWAGNLAAGETVELHQRAISATWYPQTGGFAVVAILKGQPGPAARLDFDVLPSLVTPPVFQDVTAASGISVSVPRPDACRWTSGAAWGDIEGDGDLDLFVPGVGGPATLWVNDGTGHFTEEGAARGVAGDGRLGTGAVFVDYERDGDEDLYVPTNGSNYLYRNDGTGHFTDVAAQAGVTVGSQSFSASWGDYDSDGYPDLYVTVYQACRSRTTQTADHLFHNDGEGTFTDVTDQLPPLRSTEGAGFEAAWFDYNGDGRQDLYLANDSLTEILPSRNHLWRNDGPGAGGMWTFTDVSQSSRTNYEINSMGIGIADYDRDMDLDIAVSNIAGNVLARNNGDGTFTDVAAQARVARPFQDHTRNAITWGLAFADLNLDGWEDLYVNAGALTILQPQANEVFVNAADGSGTFYDLSAPSGAADPGASKGLSIADFDRDGRMDLAVVDQGGTLHLFRNVTPYDARHWLEIRLTGTTSNTDACGARLTFSAGGVSLLREVFCGSIGLSGGSDPTVHVGLDTAAQVDQVSIEWPSGRTQVLTNVPADQLLDVTEPAAPASAGVARATSPSSTSKQ
jgi:hypothetical protein